MITNGRRRLAVPAVCSEMAIAHRIFFHDVAPYLIAVKTWAVPRQVMQLCFMSVNSMVLLWMAWQAA